MSAFNYGAYGVMITNYGFNEDVRVTEWLPARITETSMIEEALMTVTNKIMILHAFLTLFFCY